MRHGPDIISVHISRTTPAMTEYRASASQLGPSTIVVDCSTHVQFLGELLASILGEPVRVFDRLTNGSRSSFGQTSLNRIDHQQLLPI